MTTPATFKVGFIQFDILTGEVSGNMTEAERHLEHLGDAGVAMAVLPEMWSCGFDNANLARHAESTPRILDRLSKTAIRHRMVIAGSLPEVAEGRIYNTLYLLDADGRIAGTYRKIHLFSVAGEHKHFSAGTRSVVCDTALGPVGLMICYDLRFPELCRALALKGARIVVVPAQWPDIRIEVWDVLARARAMENQIYIIGANRCGVENETRFPGHSIIVDPGGSVLAWAPDGDTRTDTAVVDLPHLERIREKVPALNERMPEAYVT
ncbi:MULTISPECIES: carbon-nitrogen family hydrolase [Desulfococcus]|uniref:Nitrilase/cyanide hydratase and apolipoprotein N-acyltransferase n=1 Tax=Desulfococcus multivorans DSM 2059 TaxID=1121405 RepID=S7TNL4_DESML|nr:carbon-nitrogen family hydrolase [Desulfococcus multivorans]AOY57670.1 nitrilase/cyanide hydratase and apolipoprotein N-acyltransferase [Desulfococcus multivorans]AQV00073.1 nitrilase [Desulfococcus multivorans]EPR38752.1 Nitrilase/cyanide hydratase and apolipoprotein N-acyltransferase [Desulfococcus multivorans DSM 2059]SJZ78521.1 Carbon-nitrogen hydrolase [Desulfococcus multivorans DSM 2059]